MLIFVIILIYRMNQQRSRRFRSGKEAEELMAQIVARDGMFLLYFYLITSICFGKRTSNTCLRAQ